MQDVLQVFVVGLGGVFIGMAALYIAIHLTSKVVAVVSRGGSHDK